MAMEISITNETYVNTTAEPDFYKFYILMRNLTGLIFYPIVCSLGIVANILAIIVLSRKTMRSSSSILLLALATIDSIKILNDTLYFVTVLLREISDNIGADTFLSMYPYAHYVFNATMTCAAWITVAVAIERYIFVCHARKAKYWCTVNRAVMTSLIIAFGSFGISLPYALKYEIPQLHNITRNSSNHTIGISTLWQEKTFADIFTWIHYGMRSIIPLTILVILSGCIIRGLRKTRLGQGKSRISVCLLLVIFVFVICVFPDTVLSTFCRTGYYDASNLARGIREITDLLLLLSTCMNFIIYCIFNKLFVKTLTELFGCHVIYDTRTQRLSETMPLSIRKESTMSILDGRLIKAF